MPRLVLVVEGQTEETFVNSVLREHLASFSVYASASRVETRRGGQKGGMTTYARARGQIERWMKQEHAHADVHFTTMFDLYEIPKDFPGFTESRVITDPLLRAVRMEDSLGADLPHPRFIPYLQVHEFEALLFADPSKIGAYYPSRDKEIQGLLAAVAGFPSPEHIDDGEATAPSKRIISAIPEYDGHKPVAGPVIALEIGLPVLRAKCTHFAEWLARLEALGVTPAGG